MLLNRTITSSRPQVTTDAEGVDVNAWNAAEIIDEGVPASIQQMTAHAIAEFKRRNDVDVDYEIFTRQPLSAIVDDRITDDLNDNYEVKFPCEDMAGRGVMFCTYCRKIKGS